VDVAMAEVGKTEQSGRERGVNGKKRNGG
jgi:hypothetical protein